jgi:hypothetical protein
MGADWIVVDVSRCVKVDVIWHEDESVEFVVAFAG